MRAWKIWLERSVLSDVRQSTTNLFEGESVTRRGIEGPASMTVFFYGLQLVLMKIRFLSRGLIMYVLGINK